MNTLTLSRNQSLELRLTRSFRGTNTTDIYRINPTITREDKPKSIASEKEHSSSNTISSAAHESITIDIELPTIPIEIDHEEDIPHKRFSFYEEDDNIIIEDERDGKVYVVNNPSSPTATPSATTQKSSKEQNDRWQKKYNGSYLKILNRFSYISYILNKIKNLKEYTIFLT